MTRNLGAAVDSTFVKGLITEATGLNFPEDACTDTQNCRFNQRGNVTRRFGIDYENGFQLNTVNKQNAVISEYVWSAVAGTGTLNFVVVQIGRNLYFYKIDNNGDLSPGLKPFTVDLENFKVPGAPNTKIQLCQFATGKGYLFVCHPYCDPFYVTYNVDSDTIDKTSIAIQTRDFKGVHDSLRDEERPTMLSDHHKYNLYNQGWYAEVSAGLTAPFNLVNPITRFTVKAPGYPSNCDVWWVYKGASDHYDPDRMFGAVDIGNTPAPKGHFILNEFYQDRSAATQVDTMGPIEGLPVTTSGYNRPSNIAFYAGRVWYAGVSAQDYSSKVYYSQILDKIEKVGFCYQADDPTAETQSDLLASDGGVIDIQEVGNVIKMVAIRGALIIFADNGVWAIGGTNKASFSGTDFEIQKLATIPSISSTSFVNLSGNPVWWNFDGIYTLAYNEYNIPQVSSLTDQTIATLFRSIPNNSKKYAKGSFNQLTKEIQWIYASSDPVASGLIATEDSDPTANRDTLNVYNAILCLNTLTSAFFTWSIAGNVAVNGIVATFGTGTGTAAVTVYDHLSNPVTDHLGDTVTSSESVVQELSSVTKYLVNKSSDFTWAQERDEGYKDFASATSGIDFDSYFITSYRIRGNALAYSQIPYIVVYSKTQLGASCFVQVVWDFATSSDSNQYGRLNQVYPARSFRGIQQFRIKLRGKGRAVQLKYSSESGKPFDIQGWATFEGVNAKP